MNGELISDVKVTNAGSYLLVAFLAGFSERYFLQLFDLKGDDEKALRNTASSTA